MTILPPCPYEGCTSNSDHHWHDESPEPRMCHSPSICQDATPAYRCYSRCYSRPLRIAQEDTSAPLSQHYEQPPRSRFPAPPKGLQWDVRRTGYENLGVEVILRPAWIPLKIARALEIEECSKYAMGNTPEAIARAMHKLLDLVADDYQDLLREANRTDDLR